VRLNVCWLGGRRASSAWELEDGLLGKATLPRHGQRDSSSISLDGIRMPRRHKLVDADAGLAINPVRQGTTNALAVMSKDLHFIPAAVPFAFDRSRHQPRHNHCLIVCMKYYVSR